MNSPSRRLRTPTWPAAAYRSCGPRCWRPQPAIGPPVPDWPASRFEVSRRRSAGGPSRPAGSPGAAPSCSAVPDQLVPHVREVGDLFLDAALGVLDGGYQLPILLGDIIDHVDPVEEVRDIAGSHDHFKVADVVALIAAAQAFFERSLAIVKLGLVFIEPCLVFSDGRLNIRAPLVSATISLL